MLTPWVVFRSVLCLRACDLLFLLLPIKRWVPPPFLAALSGRRLVFLCLDLVVRRLLLGTCLVVPVPILVGVGGGLTPFLSCSSMVPSMPLVLGVNFVGRLLGPLWP